MLRTIWGKGDGRGIWGFAENRGAVNRGLTVVSVVIDYELMIIVVLSI